MCLQLKRWTLIFLYLSLSVFLFTGCASAARHDEPSPVYKTYKDIPGVTQEDIDAIEQLLADKPKLVYGIIVTTEAYENEDDTIGGFSALFSQRLTEMFGFEFDFIPCSWEEINEKIMSGDIDLSGDFTANPERQKKFFMTDPIAQRTLKIFTHSRGNGLNEIIKDRPVRCAFLKGSTTYTRVNESWDLPFEPVFVDDQYEVPKLFKDDLIDAFIEEGVIEAAFDANDFIQADEYYPLAYSPVSLATANPEIAPIIDVVQKYLKNGGYYELTQLYNQGYEDYLKYKLSAQLTETERNYIRELIENGESIAVACESDNYPISFYNTKEKEFQGIAQDTLDRISVLTGLTFKVENEPDALWPELIGGLENGRYQVITELIPTSQREGRFLWSDNPYSTSYYTMISRAEYPDIDINQIIFARVGLMANSAYADIFLEWFPDSTNVSVYHGVDRAFDALEKGEIDLLMANQNMLLNLTNYQEKPGYKANIIFKYVSDSFLGFNKKEVLLCSVMNKALQYSSVEETTDRWQRKVFDYNSKLIKDVLPFLVLFVVLLSAALFVVILFFLKNRQMNKNLEKLVENRTRELREAIDAAEGASKAKGNFLSRMSHEIRTPLNAIIGMVGIAMNSNDPERISHCLTRVDSASKHLLGIINDILDISKIEADKFELDLREFEFEKMLMRVVNVTNFRAEEKKQNFIVNLNKNVPDYIIGDDLRLSQVITNLLSNAVKFTREGGTIKLNAEKIEDNGDDIQLRIEVEDNGIGITPEQQSRLFTSFEQAEGGTARKYGGTGLGLAISKRIVELMDGEIWIESEADKGAKFIFTIKVRKGKEKAEHRVELTKKINRDELRILAVDDSPDIREYFINVMELLTLPCEVAADGAEALAMVEAAVDRPYNVFFIDWQMPGMDGIELTSRIKEKTDDNSVVFMISVSEWSLIENDALAAGVKSFVSKPLFPSTLLNVISECLTPPEPKRLDESTDTVEDVRYYDGHTILIAEDVDVNRELMTAFLEDTGLVIEFAENGRLAVEMFCEEPDKYSLIFMDIQMPEMDGYEATRAIRALKISRAQDIPIVAMTANVFKEDIENCLAAGMDDHVGKPVDPNNLFAKLDEYLM